MQSKSAKSVPFQDKSESDGGWETKKNKKKKKKKRKKKKKKKEKKEKKNKSPPPPNFTFLGRPSSYPSPPGVQLTGN